MKKIHIIIPVTISVIAAVVILAWGGGNLEKERIEVPQQGRMAFIDPETGELTSQPVDADGILIPSSPSLILGDGVASPLQKLDDGSMKIEFNGQFDKPLRASIDSDDRLEVGHHAAKENKKKDD